MLTKNKNVLDWIEEMKELTKPDQIVWIDGSDEQLDALRAQSVSSGELELSLIHIWIDYILKAPLNESLDLSDGFHVLCKIKTLALEMIDYIKKEPV